MEPPERPTVPIWVWVIVGALAIFGLLAMVQWVIGAVLGLIRLALVIVVVVAVVALVLSVSRGRPTTKP